VKITIIRQQKFADSIGVFGRLLVDGEDLCACVENGTTLIPVGTYALVPHDTPTHPNVVAFVNPALGVYHEPGDAPPAMPESPPVRFACLIHQANLPVQLEGCCAPGVQVQRFGKGAIPTHPEGGWGVTQSELMLDKLRGFWGERTNLTAEIVEDYQHDITKEVVKTAAVLILTRWYLWAPALASGGVTHAYHVLVNTQCS
jgi:hypothetical protein